MKHGNIVWFEIPVSDLARATKFYEETLDVKIQRERFLQADYGLFKKDALGVNGCLVVNPELTGKGTVLFFYVNVISDAINNALSCGGEIITPKMILKQTKDGKTTLAENMIDNEIGYYAQLLDSEGNRLSLYSHH